jgi:predicted ester cyclase
MKSTIVSMAAFPDANFGFDHVIVQGTKAACMFSMTGGLGRTNFLGVPSNGKQNRIDRYDNFFTLRILKS